MILLHHYIHAYDNTGHADGGDDYDDDCDDDFGNGYGYDDADADHNDRSADDGGNDDDFIILHQCPPFLGARGQLLCEISKCSVLDSCWTTKNLHFKSQVFNKRQICFEKIPHLIMCATHIHILNNNATSNTRLIRIMKYIL